MFFQAFVILKALFLWACGAGNGVVVAAIVFILWGEVLAVFRRFVIGFFLAMFGEGWLVLRRLARLWGQTLCIKLWGFFVVYWEQFVTRWGVWNWRRARRGRIVCRVSNRVAVLLKRLDMDPDCDIDALVAAKKYVRASIIYSRQCRIDLRFPKYSAANESIAVDWLNKHLPDSMPFSVRFCIVPLAAKLVFVKSAREEEAEECFKLLKPLVEVA